MGASVDILICACGVEIGGQSIVMESRRFGDGSGGGAEDGVGRDRDMPNVSVQCECRRKPNYVVMSQAVEQGR